MHSVSFRSFKPFQHSTQSRSTHALRPTRHLLFPPKIVNLAKYLAFPEVTSTSKVWLVRDCLELALTHVSPSITSPVFVAVLVALGATS